MNFASKSLSRRLQAMGCKSESGAKWFRDGKIYFIMSEDHPSFYDWDHGDPSFVMTAFSCEDFIGPSEQARENARILWSRPYVCNTCGKEYAGSKFCGTSKIMPHAYTVAETTYHRHTLIDLPEAEFWPYIEAALGKEREGL